MFIAKHYHASNKVGLRDNLRYLKEYNQRVPWRKNCKSIIDIGCGDGNFTANGLHKYMPDSFKELVGCDKSGDMIEYAKTHYAVENINYRVLDIEGTLPGEFYNRFNQAFSFFALHWPRNQEKTFSNIYNLLAPGGGCFFIIIGNTPSYYDVFRILSKSKKWGPWMVDVENVVSAYHDCNKPAEKIENIMENLGFTDIEVSHTINSFSFNSSDDYKMAIKGVSVFPIPENEFDHYLDDVVKVAQENGFLNADTEILYQPILVQGKKK